MKCLWGPLDAEKVWDTNGINGVYRFLKRSWYLITGDSHDEQMVRPGIAAKRLSTGLEEVEKALHKALKAVTQELEQLKFKHGYCSHDDLFK